MTRIVKPKRAARGAKRIDLSPIRDALRDGRVWTGLGVVVEPSDGGPHWKIEGDDIMIEAVLEPERVPVSARLAAGMWIVPNVGDEVAIIVPSGELDFMPTIVCVLGQAVPTVDGPSPTNIVIARGSVLIHDGNGGAEELVKRSEFLSHGHPTAPTGVVSAPVVAPAPHASPTLFPGTIVLKAK